MTRYIKNRRLFQLNSSREHDLPRYIFSFFSDQEAYSAKNKISAATKLIDYIEVKQVQFTEKALTALRDGQLNRIYTEAEIDVDKLINNFTNPRLYSYSTTV